jgi:16S rRNA (uracil1498-N3)-methyltransferase
MGLRSFRVVEFMTATRFIDDRLNADSSDVILDENESHHLMRVVRKQQGETIEIINGRGLKAFGAIGDFNGAKVRISIINVQYFPRIIPAISLAIGLPVHEHIFDAVLRGATELGATCIYPLTTSRSKKIPQSQIPSRIQRWNKIAGNACKQCDQVWFPQIMPPMKLSPFLEMIQSRDSLCLAGCEPSAENYPIPRELPDTNAREIIWTVGPEGGFSESEQDELLRNKVTFFRIGKLVVTSFVSCLAGLALLTIKYQN